VLETAYAIAETGGPVGTAKIYVSPGLSEDEQFDALQGKIFSEYGLDCKRYKANYLKRRFLARMRTVGVDGYANYARFLDANPDEYARLQDKITVNVTEFFRDASMWKYFYDELLPAWWEKTSSAWENRDSSIEPKLRIWSAGCSTGEEPYSIGILIHRFFETRGIKPPVSILATDLDEACLSHAKKAKYADIALAEVGPLDRLGFQGVGDGIVQIRPEVRDMVTFRRPKNTPCRIGPFPSPRRPHPGARR